MSEIFRVVLRDANQNDLYEAREFDLPLNSTKYPIGRASRNNTKKELAPAASNAYIDSPVISREHAVLYAETHHGTPQVYIMDCKSMHGTKLNNRMLEANKPEKLSTGDLLQFGMDVSRNEDYFIARRYVFEARLTRPFSLGFKVPEAESDDEDVAASGRRGSQSNPLTLDDSDAVSNNSNDSEPEITMIQEVVVPKDDSSVVTSAYHVGEDYPELSPQTNVVQDSYAEEEEDVLVCSSDNDAEVVHELNLDSDATSVGSSEMDMEIDYPSEEEVPDSDEDAHLLATIHDISSAIEEGCRHTLSAYNTEPSAGQPLLQSDEPTDNDTPELPPFSMLNQNFDNKPFLRNVAPPLPPRPSAQPPTWWSVGDPTTCSHLSFPWSQVGLSQSMPEHLPQLEDQLLSCAQQTALFDEAEALHRRQQMQTPPPMHISDVTASSIQQPGRRTKVSIEEIVEEQPLTPTSVKDLKRKADVLEDMETPVAKEVKVAEHDPALLEEVSTVVPVQTESVIAQRPKKQARSLLSKLRVTATYSLLGAAGGVAAVALLATAPDTFFAP